MENKILKLGFIGGGINSAVGITHQIASQMDGKFKVVSGCFSRNEKINKETANRFNIPLNRVYVSWEEFIKNERENLDAVVVLTPTHSHYEILKKLLKFDIPVICEKAVCSTLNQAEELKKIIKNGNNFFTVTFNYTGYPMVRELKNIIEKGELGEIKQIHIEMPQESFIKLGKDNRYLTPQKWRLEDKYIPTVSLDLGVHLHSLIHFLTNKEPLEVVALQDSFGHFNQVVDNVMCLAKYTGGMNCNIWFSKSALGHRNGLKIRIYGDLASAEWYQMEPETLIINDNKGKKYIIDRAENDVVISSQDRYNRFKAGHPAGFIEAFANLYVDIWRDLISFNKNNTNKLSKYCFDINTAYEGIKFFHAVSKSSYEKRWVSLDEVTVNDKVFNNYSYV